jgi:hypothetical protein
MNINQLNQCHLTENAAGVIIVTRKMVRERAVELASTVGHSAHEVSKAEWDQAKRELMGVSNPQSEESPAESVAESEGWGPAPVSAGHQVPVYSGDDEDDEGRSDTERLVEKGVRDAGRDQMRESVRAT